VDIILDVYTNIFASPTGLHVHFQVKHSIDLTLDAPLPNDPIYRHYIMENEEIKLHI
jgi:hypothetical protein